MFAQRLVGGWVLHQHDSDFMILRQPLLRAHAQHGTREPHKPEGPVLPEHHFWDSGRVYDSCWGSTPHASSRKMSHFLPDGPASLQMGKAGSRAHRQRIPAGRPSADAPGRVAGAKSVPSGVRAPAGLCSNSPRRGLNGLTGPSNAIYLERCRFAFCLVLSFSRSSRAHPPAPHSAHTLPSFRSLPLMPQTLSLSKGLCPYLKACPVLSSG